MEIEFSHGLSKLNKEQYTVVTADLYENQRILASAGSGKTTTITSRISWLIEKCGILADQILLVTFSRNASREMNGRIKALCGPTSIWSGTFHALAKTILERFNYSSIKDLYFIDELPIRWLAWLKTDKGRQWVSKLRYVIVDEFQDINNIQWRLLEAMRHPGVRFIIVGDDAQNIYTWRGSSTRYLLDYHTYVKSVKDYQLRMNYRSCGAIVAVANRIMLKIPTLPWKQEMIAAGTKGMKPEVLFFWRFNDECSWIAKVVKEVKATDSNTSIAVLARNNVDLYRIEEILLQERINCRYLSLESVVDTTSKAMVDLSTFHGSKGLEWDYTFCISLSDDCLPGRKSKEDIINERRLFYVGATRAKRRLFLTYHGNERNLSRFVREIGYKYLTYHGLAKYALSEVELGQSNPSLKRLLDSIDGDEWQTIRSLGLLPSVDAKETTYLSFEESWKPPSWCDSSSFNAFLHLFIKRILSKDGNFRDPFLERLIFTVRIFAEDAAFWSLWKEELTEMAHEFFADTAMIPPAGYAEVHEWALKRGLSWETKDYIAATSILAKIRGQIRPLRFDKYSLDEFTICQARVVVPTEYRAAVLRSWRKFVDINVPWKDCIIDIWRLSALYLVAEGRNAALYKVQEMVENLETIGPFLETTEKFLNLYTASKIECILNPECLMDDLNPIQTDCFLDNTLVTLTNEQRPDLAVWIETLLKAYCFISSGTRVDSIQLVNPYKGVVSSLQNIPTGILHKLYQYIFAMYLKKNG
jgi:AAA domain/UvrD-like helicase C-terminal domain